MNTRIEKLSRHGIMSVYRRCHPDPGAKRFFVLREDTIRILEEFRFRRSAEKWARDHARG